MIVAKQPKDENEFLLVGGWVDLYIYRVSEVDCALWMGPGRYLDISCSLLRAKRRRLHSISRKSRTWRLKMTSKRRMNMSSFKLLKRLRQENGPLRRYLGWGVFQLFLKALVFLAFFRSFFIFFNTWHNSHFGSMWEHIRLGSMDEFSLDVFSDLFQVYTHMCSDTALWAECPVPDAKELVGGGDLLVQVFGYSHTFRSLKKNSQFSPTFLFLCMMPCLTVSQRTNRIEFFW